MLIVSDYLNYDACYTVPSNDRSLEELSTHTKSLLMTYLRRLLWSLLTASFHSSGGVLHRELEDKLRRRSLLNCLSSGSSLFPLQWSSKISFALLNRKESEQLNLNSTPLKTTVSLNSWVHYILLTGTLSSDWLEIPLEGLFFWEGKGSLFSSILKRFK